MTKFDFIANIIEKNWFQEKSEKHKPKWTFSEDIKRFTVKQMENLVRLIFDCLEIRIKDEEIKNIIEIINRQEDYQVDDFIINNDFIIKFLICITISEYKIDDILFYPPEMRFRALQEISDKIGLDQNIVRKIDFNWHNHLREKIFAS